MYFSKNNYGARILRIKDRFGENSYLRHRTSLYLIPHNDINIPFYLFYYSNSITSILKLLQGYI